MISTARTRELIDDKEKTKQIREAIQQGFIAYGMQTFDQSLMGLLKRKLITFEEALRQCSNPDDFKLKVSGISSTSDLSWEDFEKGEEDAGRRNRSTLTGSDALAAALRLLTVRDMQRGGTDRPPGAKGLTRRRRSPRPWSAAGSWAISTTPASPWSAPAPCCAAAAPWAGAFWRDLAQRGVAEAVARAAVEEAEEEFDPETLLAGILARRFPGFCFAQAEDREKKRVINYFLRRGFSLAQVLTFLKEERQTEDS